MVTITFPYGIDSLRLHLVCDWKDLPDEAGPVQKVRGYSYFPPAKEDEQGWDWYIYVQPTTSPLLAAELLAHEASHIVDALEVAWNGGSSPGYSPDRIDTESRAYMVQAVVHATSDLVDQMRVGCPKQEEPAPNRKVRIYARTRGTLEWHFVKSACWCSAFEVMAALEAKDPEIETKME